MTRKLIYVEWLDHVTHDGGGWINVKKVKKGSLAACHTVGWIVEETDEALKLVSSYIGENIDDDIGGDVTIVKAAITKRKLLKL